MTVTVPDLIPDGDLDHPTGSGPQDATAPRGVGRRPWPDAGLGVLLAGVLGLVAARPLVDNSFLTHLATGRILVADGIPATNPFLYSSTAFPMPSWWWSVVLGVVDAVAGGVGLRLLTAALAALLGLLLVRLTRPTPNRPGPRTLLSVAVPAACAFVVLLPFLNARPQLPGYVLLAATVLVVRERRSPWWLVAVLALWVNVHGTWVYGLVVLGLLLIAQAVDQRRLDARQVRCAVAAGSGVVLGGLLGPRPFQLVGLPFEQFGDDRARQALAAYQEWQPPGIGNPLTWLLVAMGLVAVFGAVRARRWGVLVGSSGMVAMGLSAGRLLPLAAITLVPWVADGLLGLGTATLASGKRTRVLGALGGIAAAIAVCWIVLTPAYDLSSYPVAAVDWMARHDLAGRRDVKVLSHDAVGNYLDWRLGPRANTFVDDRAGVDAALDYATLLHGRAGWRDALRRADPDVILWRTDEVLGRRLDRGAWYDAGDFDGFSVFCRSSIAARCR